MGCGSFQSWWHGVAYKILKKHDLLVSFPLSTCSSVSEHRVLILFLWAGRLKRSSRSNQSPSPHPHGTVATPRHLSTPTNCLLPVLHFDTANKASLTLLRLANVHLAAVLMTQGGVPRSWWTSSAAHTDTQSLAPFLPTSHDHRVQQQPNL